MTYAELGAYIATLTPEQLQMDVTVFDSGNDEYYHATGADIPVSDGILDDGHPVIGF